MQPGPLALCIQWGVGGPVPAFYRRPAMEDHACLTGRVPISIAISMRRKGASQHRKWRLKGRRCRCRNRSRCLGPAGEAIAPARRSDYDYDNRFADNDNEGGTQPKVGLG